MAGVIRLKQELQFNTQLGGLLDALKSIAAQQFQTLERNFRTNKPFFDAILTIAGTFDLERLAHPFTKGAGPIGVIVVTSDTGLLGGLNQQVVIRALQEYRRQPGELMVIGERGLSYLREQRLTAQSFRSPADHERRAVAGQVRDYALNRVLAGHLGGLSIVYPKAVSFTVQRVELLRVIPCSEWLRGAHVARGVRGGPLLLESPAPGILEYLVWLWLGEQLVEVLASSRLAELAARSVHLEGSSQELQRRGKKLLMRYFRERRELIDRNIRELFAAKALYGKS